MPCLQIEETNSEGSINDTMREFNMFRKIAPSLFVATILSGCAAAPAFNPAATLGPPRANVLFQGASAGSRDQKVTHHYPIRVPALAPFTPNVDYFMEDNKEKYGIESWTYDYLGGNFSTIRYDIIVTFQTPRSQDWYEQEFIQKTLLPAVEKSTGYDFN